MGILSLGSDLGENSINLSASHIGLLKISIHVFRRFERLSYKRYVSISCFDWVLALK